VRQGGHGLHEGPVLAKDVADAVGQSHLIAHDPGQVLQKLLERAELFGADGDYGALEKLVVVDEEAELKKIIVLVINSLRYSMFQ
jgi:hypothetical protein